MEKFGLADDKEVFVELKGTHEGWHPSFVVELGKKAIAIAAPEINGIPVTLNEGEETRIQFTTPRGVYRFATKVLQRQSSPRPLYIVSMPEKVYRIQRREFVRVEVRMPILYGKLKELEKLGKKKVAGRKLERIGRKNMLHGKTIDLSGGGIRFWGCNTVEAGEQVLLHMEFLPVNICLLAEVLRCRSLKDGSGDIAAAFVDIDVKVQEAIIKWVFEYQRHLGGGISQL